jgi:hypothetical protein
MEKKELSNEHSGGGISPSSKSRSKRTPVARAHHYRNRLIDAVPKWKRANALKHGVFAINPTIPGEDVGEFIELYSAVIEEWQPSGPTEADAVFSLADLMWRKGRAQRLLRTSLIASTRNPHSPTFDERRGLDLFISCMRSEPETAFERHASVVLRADTISHLKQKFPRSNYQSTSEWAQAVIMEIESVLLPATPPSVEATEPGEGDWPEPLRKMVVETQVGASIIHGKEFFEHDLNLRERLDAMIARQVKHLIQTKGMKQMLRQAAAAREDEQPKKIAARRPPVAKRARG